jgi:hypothetical protein
VEAKTVAEQAPAQQAAPAPEKEAPAAETAASATEDGWDEY